MKVTSLKTMAMATTIAAGSAAFADGHAGPSLTAETVLSGLDAPWDMAFLPDGGMLYTEKCKGLSVLTPSGDTNALLGMSGSEGYASTQSDLFCEGQAGMNGVTIDPDFADNRRIYVYSASNMTAPGSNRVMRLTLSEDLTSVADRTDIVDDIPYKPQASDHPFGGPGAHNGGRIRFSPGDGYLYVTTGDTHNSEVPQSKTLMGGKILRIDTDGNAAEGNAAPDGFDERVYTYGHRNVQGIAFMPGSNTPVTAEHGPWHSDEITVLTNGGNAGWDPKPNLGNRGDCPDNYCGYMPNQMEGMDAAERAAFMPMTDLETYPDAMKPAWTNNGLSQGTSSAAFLEGDKWGAWEGSMVVGIMGIGFGATPEGHRIDVVKLGDDGLSAEVTEMPVPMGQGRYRSVVMGPDGALYTATDEGDISKIMPE